MVLYMVKPNFEIESYFSDAFFYFSSANNAMELSNALPLTSTGSTSTGTSQHRTMDLHGLIHPCPPVDSFEYSPEEEAYIKSIEEEVAALFPQGKIYASRAKLREEARDFADRKRFAVATDGTKICCTRCQEPQSSAKKREKEESIWRCTSGEAKDI
jgi:hypothetical protein